MCWEGVRVMKTGHTKQLLVCNLGSGAIFWPQADGAKSISKYFPVSRDSWGVFIFEDLEGKMNDENQQNEVCNAENNFANTS